MSTPADLRLRVTWNRITLCNFPDCISNGHQILSAGFFSNAILFMSNNGPASWNSQSLAMGIAEIK
jgi:hypothetical protein